MSGSIYGGLFGNIGQGMATNPSQLQNTYNPQGGLAAAYAQQQYSQQLSQLGRWKDTAPQWMIDGRVVSIEEFANEVYGDDTPEKTMFLLKYTKETK